LPTLDLGGYATGPALRAALQINVLLPIGALIALLLFFGMRHARWGLVLRTVGDSSDAARALGFNVNRVRVLATAVGGFLAGVGGAYLSLYYPGSWNEALSSGQGVMAVALVIFARWNPIGCFIAALVFGGAGSIGPALQAVGVQSGYHLFNAAPYVLTLAIMLWTSSSKRVLAGAPGELSLTR
jgi:simple sugar transport system permease protein